MYDTPDRDEGMVLISPSSRRSQAETYVTGSIVVHPNNTKQNYENLENQIGVTSPSLASFGSPPLRGLALSSNKTNSMLSGREAQFKSADPIREVINERAADDDDLSYEKHLQNHTKSVVGSNREGSFRLPPVPSDYNTPRSSVPAKGRPTLQDDHKPTTIATTGGELSERVKDVYIDSRLLIKSGARAAHLVMTALLSFFISEKEKKIRRTSSCVTKGCRGQKPETLAALRKIEPNKETRLKQAKKYFDFNQLKSLSEAQLKWQQMHGQVQIESARVISNRKSIQEQKEERKDSEEAKKGGGSFRRTSAPPKVRTDPLTQRVQGVRSSIGTPRQEARHRHLINDQNPHHKPRRKDELDTLTYQERVEPLTECTIPRSEFMKQLSPSDHKFKELVGENTKRDTPQMTNKLGEEEAKSLSSIHSSLGRGDPSDVLSSKKPLTARFGEPASRKTSNRQEVIQSPRYTSNPGIMFKDKHCRSQDVLTPSSAVQLLEQIPRESKAADVLDLMKQPKPRFYSGNQQFRNNGSFGNLKSSPYSGMMSQSSIKQPFQSTPLRVPQIHSKIGEVKTVRLSHHQDQSAATNHLARHRQEPLSRTIDISSGDGSGVGKEVYNKMRRELKPAGQIFEGKSGIQGRGLAGMISRKKI